MQAHFTVADAAWQLLRAPFAEQRSAVYQVLAVLCARGWATIEVVMHDELLRWLLDPGSETTKQVCRDAKRLMTAALWTAV